VYGLGAVAGADGFVTRDQRAFYRSLAALPRDRGVHLLRGLGVSSLVGRDAIGAPEGTRFSPAAPPWRYRLPDPAPRAYFAERVYAVARDPVSALEAVASADFRPGRDVVLMGSESNAPYDLPAGEIRRFSAEAGTVLADVRSSGDGLWVLSDTWFPGWRATIDGEPAEIIRANGLLRALRVPRGLHRLVMHYEPSAFRVGGWISIVTAAMFIVLGVWAATDRDRW
jgi:hypothetical protein